MNFFNFLNKRERIEAKFNAFWKINANWKINRCGKDYVENAFVNQFKVAPFSGPFLVQKSEDLEKKLGREDFQAVFIDYAREKT